MRKTAIDAGLDDRYRPWPRLDCLLIGGGVSLRSEMMHEGFIP